MPSKQVEGLPTAKHVTFTLAVLSVGLLQPRLLPKYRGVRFPGPQSAAFHDTDTDILGRILEDDGVAVGVGVLECGLKSAARVYTYVAHTLTLNLDLDF